MTETTPTPQAKATRVYLSYPQNRRELAEDIVTQLREHGVDAGDLNDSIAAGEDIRSRLKDSIRQSQAMIALVTPESLDSDWLSYEIGLAEGLERLVIPILVDVSPESLPGRLATTKRLRVSDLADIHAILDGGISSPPSAAFER